MKRIFSYLLVITLVFSMSCSTAFAYSAKDIVVTSNSQTANIDGEEATLEVSAQIINNRVMVPVRFIAENLGFTVVWDKLTRTILIGENAEIKVPIGSATAVINGKSITLDSPAVIIDGCSLVPLRLIMEGLGAEVEWNSEKKSATITYSKQLVDATSLYGVSVEGEDDVLAALDYQFAYDFAVKLASFGDSERGFHLIGSKSGNKASQYVYDTFKTIGLNPQLDPVEAQGWEYYDSSIKIEGKPDLNYFITSAPYTPATPDEGITADVVYVGKATKEELDGVDLKGKIAIADFDWDYSLWMNNIEFAVANKGAVGLIYYTTNPYGVDESGQAEFVADWSGKAATIPTWSMRLSDGTELAAMAQNETLRVTAVSDCKTIDNATGYNVLATIKGTKYPDEYIVINAHKDAYFHCLQDDSAPVGIMMAMAKAIVKSGYKPDRSIIFAVTDGEECGGGETFYDWLVGSWDLVNEKVNSWGGKIVDAHTIELVADNKSTNFGYRVSDPMLLFTKAMAAGMNTSGDYTNQIVVENYMSTASDEWSFSYIGAPTTRTIRENASTEVYHSSMDNPERFNNSNYIEYIDAQTTLMLRIDKQALAPYDLAYDAELYLDTLDKLKLESCSQDYSNLSSAAESYLTTAGKLLEANLEISKLYKEAATAGKNLENVDLLIKDYNASQRESIETVLKATQYIALDQPVNQVQYYQNIPSVFDDAITTLQEGNQDKLLDSFYGLDNDDMGQYSVWYSECLDYDTWANSYREALQADPDADYKWASERLLKYYDFYAILNSVNAKIEANDNDFNSEISALTAMKKDAEKRLQNGVAADTLMWSKAESQIPFVQLEKIKAALESL